MEIRRSLSKPSRAPVVAQRRARNNLRTAQRNLHGLLHQLRTCLCGIDERNLKNQDVDNVELGTSTAREATLSSIYVPPWAGGDSPPSVVHAHHPRVWHQARPPAAQPPCHDDRLQHGHCHQLLQHLRCTLLLRDQMVLNQTRSRLTHRTALSPTPFVEDL